MSGSVSSEPFRALAAALKDGGFASQAQHLEDVLNGTWTTSTEMIGALGEAVLSARRECRPLTGEHKALIKSCLRQVRIAWPGFGLFSWLPFGR